MNKSDFVQQLTDRLGNSRAAEAAYDAFMTTLNNGIANDGSVTLPCFGRFSVVQRKARTGRNPTTGQVIDIPAKKALVFHPARNMALKVNNG